MNILRECMRWRLPDYIGFAVVFVISWFVGGKVKPHCRPFTWDDPSISHPVTPSIFRSYTLGLMIALPLFVYIAGELLTRCWRPLVMSPRRRRQHRSANRWQSALLHTNGWLLAHIYGFAVAIAIVSLAKLYAGRLRPDFLARLAAEGFVNNSSFDPSVASGPVCDAALEGRKSFPSGHSCISFSAFVPVCMYLLGLTRQLHRGRSLLIITLCMLPLILPIAVAVSRTIDYHHHFDDIVAGAVIGTACPVVAVLLVFRVSDTGEWTLRTNPVYKADVLPLTAADRRAGPRCIFNACDVCCASASDSDADDAARYEGRRAATAPERGHQRDGDEVVMRGGTKKEDDDGAAAARDAEVYISPKGSPQTRYIDDGH